jgi:hypothetical protein
MLAPLLNLAQAKVVELDPGLFVIRYVSSPARVAPVITIACEHGSHRDVTLLSPPGYSAGKLVQPGDALVVQARQCAQLSVQVRSSVPNGSWEAQVSVERLGRSLEEEDGTAPEFVDESHSRFVDQSKASGPGTLELLAHVARLGDIRVPAGDWIAGPDSPARIEGLALTWHGGTRDIDLRYAVRVGGHDATLMEANGDGSFVGTRGQARPLTEIRFEIDGPAAEDTELVIDALFQGGMPVRARGRSIYLTGSSGREALVGLRVALVDVATHEIATHEEDMPVARPDTIADQVNGHLANESSERVSRVRVFRSSPQMRR